MKLLFDQNLSHHLVKALASEFPESTHVRYVGLEKALDGPVWEYAKANRFVIVSKDSDFHQRSTIDRLQSFQISSLLPGKTQSL